MTPRFDGLYCHNPSCVPLSSLGVRKVKAAATLGVGSEAGYVTYVEYGVGLGPAPRECHLCRREAPCECMTSVRDGGPWWFNAETGLFEYHGRHEGGWSLYPWRCMCTCGGCQS